MTYFSSKAGGVDHHSLINVRNNNVEGDDFGASESHNASDHEYGSNSFEKDLTNESHEWFSGFSIGAHLLSAERKSMLIKVSNSFSPSVHLNNI